MLNRKYFISIIAALTGFQVAGISLAETTTTDAAPASQNKNVVAVVNDEPLTTLNFEAYIKTRLERGQQPGQLSQQQRQQIFNDYINRELIYQDAVKKGISEHPVIKAEIENQRHNIITGFAIAQLLRQPASEADMRSIYEQQFNKPGMEFKTRHILVKTEAEAKAIIARLDKGADFIQLAKKLSIDASAKNGGELNWLAQNRMIPGYANGVVSLKKGTHSQQPVKSRFGWHIIRLEGTRQTPPPTFDEVKERVLAVLRNQRIAAYINHLRQTANVVIK